MSDLHLFREYHQHKQAGNAAEVLRIRNEIITHNLGLWIMFARKQEDVDATLGEVVIHVIKLIDKFKLERGKKFSDYCMKALFFQFAYQRRKLDKHKRMVAESLMFATKGVPSNHLKKTKTAHYLLKTVRKRFGERNASVTIQHYGISKSRKLVQPKNFVEIGKSINLTKQMARLINLKNIEYMSEIAKKYPAMVE